MEAVNYAGTKVMLVEQPSPGTGRAIAPTLLYESGPRDLRLADPRGAARPARRRPQPGTERAARRGDAAPAREAGRARRPLRRARPRAEQPRGGGARAAAELARAVRGSPRHARAGAGRAEAPAARRARRRRGRAVAPGPGALEAADREDELGDLLRATGVEGWRSRRRSSRRGSTPQGPRGSADARGGLEWVDGGGALTARGSWRSCTRAPAGSRTIVGGGKRVHATWTGRRADDRCPRRASRARSRSWATS